MLRDNNDYSVEGLSLDVFRKLALNEEIRDYLAPLFEERLQEVEDQLADVEVIAASGPLGILEAFLAATGLDDEIDIEVDLM